MISRTNNELLNDIYVQSNQNNEQLSYLCNNIDDQFTNVTQKIYGVDTNINNGLGLIAYNTSQTNDVLKNDILYAINNPKVVVVEKTVEVPVEKVVTVVKEIPIIKEVVKEVPVEKIVTVEKPVIKEVIKEKIVDSEELKRKVEILTVQIDTLQQNNKNLKQQLEKYKDKKPDNIEQLSLDLCREKLRKTEKELEEVKQKLSAYKNPPTQKIKTVYIDRPIPMYVRSCR